MYKHSQMHRKNVKILEANWEIRIKIFQNLKKKISNSGKNIYFNNM
jgi:hypothetical protein